MIEFYTIHSELNNFLNPIINSNNDNLTEGEVCELIDDVLKISSNKSLYEMFNQIDLVSSLMSQELLDGEKKETFMQVRKVLSELFIFFQNKENNKISKQMKASLQKLIKVISLKITPIKTQSVDQIALIEKLNTLQELDEVKKAKCIKLIEEYAETYVANGVELYQNEEICNKLAVTFRPQDNARAKYFDAEFQKIFLFCKIAHIFENNGIPQEHALKLVILFDNAKSTIDALKVYGEQLSKKGDQALHQQNYIGQYIHNACLFTMPDTLPKNWSLWRKLLSLNLSDPTYKNLLSNSDRLESFYEAELAKHIDMPKDTYQKVIPIVHKEITELKCKIKKAQNVDTTSEVVKLNEKLVKFALSHLYCNIKLTEWPKDAIKGLYNIYLGTKNPHFKYLAENGLTNSMIQKFSSLDTSNAGKNIPNIENGFLKLNSLNGYYFRKLDVSNCPDDAALGACLGKFTNCCQSMGGAGHDCAVHGLTSPNGGFYVLFIENLSSPKSSDTIAAQSWVWVGTNGELVFDSIEWNNSKISEEKVVKAYGELLKYLTSSHLQIDIVYVGSGATPPSLGVNIGVCAQPINYTGYRDSTRQKLLYHKEMPYLSFFGFLLSDEESQSIREISTDILISEFEKQITSNHISGFMRWLIKVHYHMPSVITYFNLSRIEKPVSEKLHSILKANQDFCDKLKDNDSVWNKELIYYFYINGVDFSFYIDRYNGTFIDKILGNLELLTYASNLLSYKIFIDAISIRTTQIKSAALRTAANKIEIFTFFVDYFKSKNDLDLFYKLIFKYDVLITACKNTQILKVIFDNCRNDEHKNLVYNSLEKISNRESIFNRACDYPESLELMFSFYSDKKRLLHAVRLKNGFGKILLHTTSISDSALSTQLIIKLYLDFMELYKDKDLLVNDLVFQDDCFETPLDRLTHRPENLALILKHVSIEQRFDLILSSGVMFEAVEKVDSLSIIFNSLQPGLANISREKILKLILNVCYSGSTIMENSLKFKGSLISIFDFLPDCTRLEAVLFKDKKGVSLLNSPSIFLVEGNIEYIFNSLPVNERICALCSINQDSPLVLHAQSKHIFSYILDVIPDNDYLNAHEFILKLFMSIGLPQELELHMQARLERYLLANRAEPFLLTEHLKDVSMSTASDISTDGNTLENEVKLYRPV